MLFALEQTAFWAWITAPELAATAVGWAATGQLENVFVCPVFHLLLCCVREHGWAWSPGTNRGLILSNFSNFQYVVLFLILSFHLATPFLYLFLLNKVWLIKAHGVSIYFTGNAENLVFVLPLLRQNILKTSSTAMLDTEVVFIVLFSFWLTTKPNSKIRSNFSWNVNVEVWSALGFLGFFPYISERKGFSNILMNDFISAKLQWQ